MDPKSVGVVNKSVYPSPLAATRVKMANPQEVLGMRWVGCSTALGSFDKCHQRPSRLSAAKYHKCRGKRLEVHDLN